MGVLFAAVANECWLLLILEPVDASLLVEELLVDEDLRLDGIQKLNPDLLEWRRLFAVEDDTPRSQIKRGVQLLGVNQLTSDFVDGSLIEFKESGSGLKRQALEAALVVEDEALESELFDLVQDVLLRLLGIGHLTPDIQLLDVLEARLPLPLMDLLTGRVDVVERVLRNTKETLALIELEHLPEGLRSLAVLVGVRIVNKVRADDEHRADVMNLLDELPREVLVMRYKLPVGFGRVDLSEDGAEPHASKDL